MSHVNEHIKLHASGDSLQSEAVCRLIADRPKLTEEKPFTSPNRQRGEGPWANTHAARGLQTSPGVASLAPSLELPGQSRKRQRRSARPVRAGSIGDDRPAPDGAGGRFVVIAARVFATARGRR